MSASRRVFFPAILVAAAILAGSGAVKPVEARTTGVSAELVSRVFSPSNFPMDTQSAPVLPDGKGKDLVQQKCVTCHAANVWMSQHHTRDQWGTVLDDMTSKGLQASDDELDTIVDYLAQNFGPVAKAAPSPATPATDPAAPKPPAR